MIGRAGTGSPEAGVVLRVDSCLHLADGGGTRQDTQGPMQTRTRESSVQCARLSDTITPRVTAFYTVKFVFAGDRTSLV